MFWGVCLLFVCIVNVNTVTTKLQSMWSKKVIVKEALGRGILHIPVG